MGSEYMLSIRYRVDGGQQVGVASRHDAIQDPVAVAGRQHAVDHNVAGNSEGVVQTGLRCKGHLQKRDRAVVARMLCGAQHLQLILQVLCLQIPI